MISARSIQANGQQAGSEGLWSPDSGKVRTGSWRMELVAARKVRDDGLGHCLVGDREPRPGNLAKTNDTRLERPVRPGVQMSEACRRATAPGTGHGVHH